MSKTLSEELNGRFIWELPWIITKRLVNNIKTIYMSFSKMFRRVLNPTLHKLNKAGYITDTGEITEAGRNAAMHVIYAKYEAELVAAADEKIAADEEASAKK